jgi:hypothetical protein
MKILRLTFILLLGLYSTQATAGNHCAEVYEDILSTLKEEQRYFFGLPDSYHDRQHLDELGRQLEDYSEDIVRCIILDNPEAIGQIIIHLNLITAFADYIKENPEQFRDSLMMAFEQYYAELIAMMEDLLKLPEKPRKRHPQETRLPAFDS